MSTSWDDARAALRDAAGWFVATTALVADRWASPGLGEWDVRALVGHTSRSLLTVEAYLDVPEATIEVPSAVAYYAAISRVSVGPAVAERGRAAGAALGDDPARAVSEIAARVLPLVDPLDGGELLTTLAGGMRLRDYLPTRVLELVVHTADLATALGVPAEPPALAAEHALRLVLDLAVHRGAAAPLLLAATGRPAAVTSVL